MLGIEFEQQMAPLRKGVTRPLICYKWLKAGYSSKCKKLITLESGDVTTSWAYRQNFSNCVLRLQKIKKLRFQVWFLQLRRWSFIKWDCTQEFKRGQESLMQWCNSSNCKIRIKKISRYPFPLHHNTWHTKHVNETLNQLSDGKTMRCSPSPPVHKQRIDSIQNQRKKAHFIHIVVRKSGSIESQRFHRKIEAKTKKN